MNVTQLESTARALVSPGKGILAADESIPPSGSASTRSASRTPRKAAAPTGEMLFTTPGVGRVHQRRDPVTTRRSARQADDGTPFAELLDKQGIIPGIKVDKGPKPLAGSPGELVTEGLDGLRERLAEYRELGARFAKWRAVINDRRRHPDRALHRRQRRTRSRATPRSARRQGIVPIVEPEVLMDGDHTIERCYEVTEATLHTRVRRAVRAERRLEGMLLKPNMVISGKELPEQAGVEEVAEATVRCLRRTVPAAVPGIVFLSGGQSDELATAHLNAMNAHGPAPVAAVVLVRPRAAGGGPEGVEGRRGPASPPARRRSSTAPGSTASPAPAGMRPRWNRWSHSPTDEDAGHPGGRRPGAGHQRGHRGGDHRGPEPGAPGARLRGRLQVAHAGGPLASARAAHRWGLPDPLRGRLHPAHRPRQPHPVSGIGWPNL